VLLKGQALSFSIQQWWDVCVYALLGGIHVAAWLSVPLQRLGSFDSAERSLSATALGSACTAGITAVSILIPACMLVLQFGLEGKQMPPFTAMCVFRAAVWFCISLTFGLFVLFVSPMRVNSKSVAHDHLTGVPLGLQLIAIFIGMIWFVVAVVLVVRHLGGVSR
jgi:hypothetical protein